MEPSFQWYWQTFLYRLPAVLPWLVGAVAGFGVLSFSPLGQALTKHLRARRAETELLEDLVSNITDLRREVGEALERLDSAERRLRQVGSGSQAPDSQSEGSASRVSTPH